MIVKLINIRCVKVTLNALTILIKRQFNVFSSLHSNKLFNSLPTPFLNLHVSGIKRGYMDLTSVIKVFEELVPPNLSETWDNTGLLIEPSGEKKISTILFTNDLTEAVLEEALTKKSDLIISYHPPIFSPMKSLKQSNWKDCIVIRCIENSVAVYSPHTCCDAVAGGVNDWLIHCFDLSDCHPIIQSYEMQPKYSHIIEFAASPYFVNVEMLKSVPNCNIIEHRPSRGVGSEDYKIKVNKASLSQIMKLLMNDKDSLPSIQITALNPEPLVGCGMGRIGKLKDSLPLQACIELIKQFLNLNHVRVSLGVSHSLDTLISVVAVCAGSGSSVLKGASADLYITGEMSHHDLLDVNHRNVSVILCEHSNSERGYLLELIKSLSPKLNGIKLVMSSSDKDPICII